MPDPGDFAPTERTSTMGDPFGMRDDACWECIIRELRKSNHADVADRLQEALKSPFPKNALSLVDTMNPGHRLSIDPAAQTCRFKGNRYPLEVNHVSGPLVRRYCGIVALRSGRPRSDHLSYPRQHWVPL